MLSLSPTICRTFCDKLVNSQLFPILFLHGQLFLARYNSFHMFPLNTMLHFQNRSQMSITLWIITDIQCTSSFPALCCRKFEWELFYPRLVLYEVNVIFSSLLVTKEDVEQYLKASPKAKVLNSRRANFISLRGQLGGIPWEASMEDKGQWVLAVFQDHYPGNTKPAHPL